MPGHIYILFYHCTDIWPQLRTRCAGEEAQPSTCVGYARAPVRLAWGCKGPFRRAPVTTPSPGDTRSVLVLAVVGALQLQRSRRDGDTSKCAGGVCKRTYRYLLWLLS